LCRCVHDYLSGCSDLQSAAWPNGRLDARRLYSADRTILGLGLTSGQNPARSLRSRDLKLNPKSHAEDSPPGSGWKASAPRRKPLTAPPARQDYAASYPVISTE
jgi:hypothetical protein